MADPHAGGESADEAPRLKTPRLDLQPLPAEAARALAGDRALAGRLVGAELAPDWPLPDLLDVLPLQTAGGERFGVWTIVERATRTVVGDVGFVGPPDEGGTVEIGYSVVPSRRGRGYAAEAAQALVEWALGQAGVDAVVAGCAPDNAASVRTLERIGFERTERAHGEIRWRFGRA